MEGESNGFSQIKNQIMSAEFCHPHHFGVGKIQRVQRVASFSFTPVNVYYAGRCFGEIIEIHSPEVYKNVIFQYDEDKLGDKFISLLGQKIGLLDEDMQQATQTFQSIEECADWLLSLLKQISPRQLFY